jgi:hypothetical protein
LGEQQLKWWRARTRLNSGTREEIMRKAILAAVSGLLLFAVPFVGATPPVGERLTLEGRSLRAADISRIASEQLGVPLVYIAHEPQALLDLDIKALPKRDLPAVLAKTGTVAMVSRAVRSDAILDTVRFTLRAENATVERVAEALRRVSEEHVLFVPRDPHQGISLDYKKLTLAQLQGVLASFGEIRRVP